MAHWSLPKTQVRDSNPVHKKWPFVEQRRLRQREREINCLRKREREGVNVEKNCDICSEGSLNPPNKIFTKRKK